MLTDRCRQRLIGVHPDLVRVIERASLATEPLFIVTEGVRTKTRQAELLKAGASQTMHSRHIVGDDGFAHAVDLAVVVGHEARWDWPLYRKLAAVVKAAASMERVTVEWGGDWIRFRDGPHFQLPHLKYR